LQSIYAVDAVLAIKSCFKATSQSMQSM
jgi:hypothetical protein